jgi:hypothetical protein
MGGNRLTCAQLPVVIFAFDSSTPRTGVWQHNSDTLLSGLVQEATLLSSSILVTGQTSEVEEDWHWRRA